MSVTIRFRQSVTQVLVLKCLNISLILRFYETLRFRAETKGNEM